MVYSCCEELLEVDFTVSVKVTLLEDIFPFSFDWDVVLFELLFCCLNFFIAQISIVVSVYLLKRNLESF